MRQRSIKTDLLPELTAQCFAALNQKALSSHISLFNLFSVSEMARVMQDQDRKLRHVKDQIH